MRNPFGVTQLKLPDLPESIKDMKETCPLVIEDSMGNPVAAIVSFERIHEFLSCHDVGVISGTVNSLFSRKRDDRAALLANHAREVAGSEAVSEPRPKQPEQGRRRKRGRPRTLEHGPDRTR